MVVCIVCGVGEVWCCCLVYCMGLVGVGCCMCVGCFFRRGEGVWVLARRGGEEGGGEGGGGGGFSQFRAGIPIESLLNPPGWWGLPGFGPFSFPPLPLPPKGLVMFSVFALP